MIRERRYKRRVVFPLTPRLNRMTAMLNSDVRAFFQHVVMLNELEFRTSGNKVK